MAHRYGPPRVIVNSGLESVADSEEAVLLTAGAGSLNLLQALKESAADELANAIRTAGGTGNSVRLEGVKLGEDASLREIGIEVTPLGPERRHFLIVAETFPNQAEPDLGPKEALAGADKRTFEKRVGRLEKELASSRSHLESVIVEQEAANEEVVASNEELQSLNEELESSKEEMEATNEELATVNQELQVRNTELERSREFAQATIDTVRGSLVVLGPDLRVLKANRSFYRTFHLSPAEVEHRFIFELGNGLFALPKLRMLLEETLPADRVTEDVELQSENPSAGGRILLLNARRFEAEQRILLAIEDVTERRRVEEELRQAQKMEAIGYLAAGVAHDFNNLLTGVIGNASLLLEAFPEGAPHRSTIENVIAGGERAAELTRQLLAYAGKGRFYLERVNLSDLVIQTGRLIHASVPPTVQLRLDLDKSLPLLLADPSQMQQVVMNLMINAVEAVGDSGGAVQVRTGSQTVADEPLENCVTGEKPARGEYVFVEVIDNGKGMDEQTVRKIFDPFFTTKFTGRGLGLAAVLGIVRQHKGAVLVHSVPGRGTSFRVLLSTVEETPSRVAHDEPSGDVRGAGTVLVVDDEELIRNFVKHALEPFGYGVLLAANGLEAVRSVKESAGEIGLVLLDVAMPGMDGLETLIRIREMTPDVPVLVCSGFGDKEVEAHFAGQSIAGFFPKPYTVKQLARKVKECIAPAAGKASA
jgi:nitrogen-specific signal transduction histidine kinase